MVRLGFSEIVLAIRQGALLSELDQYERSRHENVIFPEVS